MATTKYEDSGTQWGCLEVNGFDPFLPLCSNSLTVCSTTNCSLWRRRQGAC